MQIPMATNNERQRAPFYLYKNQKIANAYIYIQKFRHFAKSKTICVTFLFTKSQTLYVMQFFMKILKFAFIYKKHENLRYVRFVYTKIRIPSKKQDNLCYVFYIQKSGQILRYAVFMEF